MEVPLAASSTPVFLLSSQVGNNDIDDVNIIVFRQINQFDLSGNVITSSEYLPTLWVRPDFLGSSALFFPASR